MRRAAIRGRRFVPAFDRQCQVMHLPRPVAEHRFHPTRRWKFDWAFVDQQLAVEVEGGAWTNGRHTRGTGFSLDLIKYAEATCLGWTVLRVLPQHIQDGTALGWVERILQRGEAAPLGEMTRTRGSVRGGGTRPASERIGADGG